MKSSIRASDSPKQERLPKTATFNYYIIMLHGIRKLRPSLQNFLGSGKSSLTVRAQIGTLGELAVSTVRHRRMRADNHVASCTNTNGISSLHVHVFAAY